MVLSIIIIIFNYFDPGNNTKSEEAITQMKWLLFVSLSGLPHTNQELKKSALADSGPAKKRDSTAYA